MPFINVKKGCVIEDVHGPATAAVRQFAAGKMSLPA
jgi:hypothetical protein